MRGIYAIVHTLSGRLYVGSSIRIECRWRDHQGAMNRGKHYGSPHLLRAWQKYGQSAFRLIVLEIIENIDEQYLTEREQFYLDLFSLKYNSNPIAGRPPNHKGIPLSKEHAQKISVSNMGRIVSIESRMKSSATRKARPGPGNRLGAKHTIEAKLKMSRSRMGTPGPIISAEGLRKLREINLGKLKTPETINKLKIAGKKFWETKWRWIYLWEERRNARVPEEKVPEFLKLGWKLGKIKLSDYITQNRQSKLF